MSKLRIILPSFLLLLFTLTFSYVYAAFSNDFTVNGVASVEKATVMITGIDVNSINGNASFSSLRKTVNSVTMPVTLSAGASIVFDMTVHNYDTINYEISDLQFNNDNLDVLFTKQGCFLADQIDSHNTYTCNITITNTGSSTISDAITATYTYTPISDYSLIHHIETLTNGIDEGYIDDLKDDTDTTNAYHYVGSNPRNYVFFNGDYWRILSLDYNVQSTDGGKPETKIKLVKESSIQSNKHLWDITDTFSNSGRGIAEWTTSKLRATLNDLYYTSGSGTCYITDKSSTTSTCDFSAVGLNRNPLVSSTLWYHGASQESALSPLGMYQDLRSDKKPSDSSCWGLSCTTGSSSFTTKSVNYVGLMSPSDYGFTTNGSTSRSRDDCLNTPLSDASWKTGGACGTSWLTHSNGIEWTIQPSINNSSHSYVFSITKDGLINDEYAYKRYYIRPSIYLDPGTLYYSGSGLRDDPYIIDQTNSTDIFTVTFNANGGSGTMPVQLIKNGATKALTPNQFKREGYSFIGWSEYSDATTPMFDDMAYITAIGNTTLYAIWQKETSIYEYMQNNSLGTAQANNINFGEVSSSTNGQGIYEYTGLDSDGGNKTIYYYRGAVNNNVIFANQCWKIIRSTSTGGAKLIYNGSVVDGTCPGNTTNLTKTGFSTINTAEAAGYMYENGVQHGLTNDSAVKVANDTFLYYNLRGYTSYLEDISFCNDRSVQSGNTYSSTGSSFNFNRYSLGTPTLTCPNTNDNFTVDPSHGNGKLSMPVGVITADEMILAGSKNGADSANSTYYLKTDYQYWTATPRQWNGTKVKVWRVNEDGSIGSADNDANNKYVRPVIALNGTSYLGEGDGTVQNPFTIKNNGIEQYAVSYDGNGATSGSMTYQLVNGGEDVKLHTNEFTKAGYHFIGWSTRYDGNVLYENEETINVTADIILYAVWELNVIDFDYTGTVQSYVLEDSGVYRLEVWGAQGGSYNSTYVGGYGAYATGIIKANAGVTVYVVVGGAGTGNTIGQLGTTLGGYNGGGNGNVINADVFSGSGGGASHIALVSGELKTLENQKDNNYILITAAGGSGAYGYDVNSNNWWSGASGGGITGGYNLNVSQAGTQTSGYAFGAGGDQSGGTIANTNHAGGGGGWYGGFADYADNNSGGLGGGSSNISNYYLASNEGLTKHMAGYDVTTSESENTYTINANSHSATSLENVAKEGNGHARISYLGAL